MSERWHSQTALLAAFNARADELLKKADSSGDNGAHDLAKLYAFRAMGLVDAISIIRVGGSPLPVSEEHP